MYTGVLLYFTAILIISINFSLSVTVKVNEGILRGAKSLTKDGFEYFEFLSVPYAKKPVGELRFQSPQPPEPWADERDATKVDIKNIASQIPMSSSKVVGSEDCLYLNVYTPKIHNDSLDLLPVMVNIHSGGFIFGSGIIKDDNGPDFFLEKNVVVVSINYRLDIFGFLSLGIKEARGNMGLKDQIQALKWINDNIIYFGGDKKKITLIGVSAGSASIEYLILSNKAKNLFQKAILHSGSTLNHWSKNNDIINLAIKVAKEFGFNKTDPVEIYKFLSKKSHVDLILASNKVVKVDPRKRIFFGFVPTVEKQYDDDDFVIAQEPFKHFKEGKFNNVTVIRGFCNMEGLLTYGAKPTAYKELKLHKNFIEALPYAIDNNEKWNNLFLEVYMNKSYSDKDFAIDFFTDLDFASGIWIANRLMTDNGIKSYMYQFSYDGGLNFLKNIFGFKHKGAAHADDVGYIYSFETYKGISDLDKIVRKRMVKMWTDFVKTGNPTPEISENIPIIWSPFSKNHEYYLSIDKELKLQKDYNSQKMDLFYQLYEKFYY